MCVLQEAAGKGGGKGVDLDLWREARRGPQVWGRRPEGERQGGVMQTTSPAFCPPGLFRSTHTPPPPHWWAGQLLLVRPLDP